MLNCPYSYVNMTIIFLDILQGLNFYDWILGITLDNASKNDKILETIHRRGRLQFCKIFYLNCSTPIIHLVIQEDLKMPDDFISRIRDTLLHISASGPKIQSCKQVCK